jgi:predicted acylesterase/phospholipase RssA
MVNDLSMEWQNLTTSQVEVNWTHPAIDFRLYGAMYNDDPLFTLLNSKFEAHNKTLYRKLSIGATDVNHGMFVVMNETISDPVKAVISSGSIPFAFVAQRWK